nr:hypothetical protein [uncultured Dongia sp.]
MKHATGDTLDRLEPLLRRLRQFAVLKEKSRGAFYLKSKSLLHFHEDPAGLFADLRVAEDWTRFPVNTKAEQNALLKVLGDILDG